VTYLATERGLAIFAVVASFLVTMHDHWQQPRFVPTGILRDFIAGWIGVFVFTSFGVTSFFGFAAAMSWVFGSVMPHPNALQFVVGLISCAVVALLGMGAGVGVLAWMMRIWMLMPAARRGPPSGLYWPTLLPPHRPRSGDR
jgi:hypothetical protein